MAQVGYDTDGQGSRVAPYMPKHMTSKNASNVEMTEQFRSISAMQQYAAKSHEELRFEDYRAGTKGKAGAQLFPSIAPSKVPQPQQAGA